MANRPQDKMLARLREMGLEVPADAHIRRVYPSASQRNVGAWSWTVIKADGYEAGIGSQWSIGELLRGRMVASLGYEHGDDWDVDPHREGEVYGTTRYISRVLIEKN